ncbi:MAG: 4Fe-4S binding protein [Nannocystis sp.]|nr:4Fe-4S binding protein [Nannocystis sp.]
MIGVDHQSCILCDRCRAGVRRGAEQRGDHAIGEGLHAKIAFDLDQPDGGASSCVSCGDCMDACPTDALVNKQLPAPLRPSTALEAGGDAVPVLRGGAARSRRTWTRR